MGGKKKAQKTPLKKESKYKIPNRFDCPLCDGRESITIKLHRTTFEGTAVCRFCRAGQGHTFVLRSLEKPVDVFFRLRELLEERDKALLSKVNPVPSVSDFSFKREPSLTVREPISYDANNLNLVNNSIVSSSNSLLGVPSLNESNFTETQVFPGNQEVVSSTPDPQLKDHTFDKVEASRSYDKGLEALNQIIFPVQDLTTLLSTIS